MHPQDDVGDRARTEADHDADRPGRIVLSPKRAGYQGQGHSAATGKPLAVHPCAFLAPPASSAPAARLHILRKFRPPGKLRLTLKKSKCPNMRRFHCPRTIMFQVFNCLTTQHDWRLVVVAGVVCFVAALTAISLFHRARAALGGVRSTWIMAAGVMVGCGIWATHFIAMLAYEPGCRSPTASARPRCLCLAAMVITAFGLRLAAVGSERLGPADRRCDRRRRRRVHALSRHVGARSAGPYDVVDRIGRRLRRPRRPVRDGGDGGCGSLPRRRAPPSVAATLLTLAIVSHHFTAMGAEQIVAGPQPHRE